MEAAEFAQFAVGDEALVGGWKCDGAVGFPEIGADVCWDGFLADEGELF